MGNNLNTASTPLSLGMKKRTLVPPKEGWAPQTFYKVELACSSNNVIHRGILYSGFATETLDGSSYAFAISSVGEKLSLGEIFYLKPLGEILWD